MNLSRLSFVLPFTRRLVRSLLLTATVASAAPKPGEIILGTILPSGTEQYRLLQELGQRWQRDSGGTVKLILHPDGRLGGESDMVKQIGIGKINAGLFSVVGLSDIDPGVTGLQIMPLTFRSWAEVDYVREKLRPQLEARLHERGYQVICWADAGWVRFFSTEAAVTTEDIRRLKLFVWAGSEAQITLMKSIGCQPVALETSDLLMGLQTKMIHAAPMPPVVAVASQLYRPAPHMLDMNWCPIVGAVVVKAEVWERIPVPIRTRMMATADAVGTKLRARGRLEDEEAVTAMKQHGLKIHALPAEAAAGWEKLREQVYPHIRGSMVPADIFDAVGQHLSDFRADRTATP
jgi:TRAP-type C4-dicarboxylate transport system substrate-binding protein